MDAHLEITNQTECTNIFSQDVNKYFAETFYNLNNMSKTYDFFYELRPTNINIIEEKKFKMKYISQVFKLFDMAFSYDKEKDKVNIPDMFKNVRFHYFDIRDYLESHIMRPLENVLYNSAQFMYNSWINLDILADIIRLLNITKEQLDKTCQLLSLTNINPEKKSQIIKKYTGPEDQTITNLNTKIRISYKHDNIKKILVLFFDDYIKILNSISQMIEEFTKDLHNYGVYINNNYGKLIKERKDKYTYGTSPNIMRKIIVDIVNKCSDIYDDAIFTFAKIIDIYMLRRFLDKDYITNGIVYSGAAHSESYIRILVTYFDFKITHVSYSTIKNLDELNKEIIAREKNNDDVLDFFIPIMLNQCSNISHFPENFE